MATKRAAPMMSAGAWRARMHRLVTREHNETPPGDRPSVRESRSPNEFAISWRLTTIRSRVPDRSMPHSTQWSDWIRLYLDGDTYRWCSYARGCSPGGYLFRYHIAMVTVDTLKH
jgi:hypothetical protein